MHTRKLILAGATALLVAGFFSTTAKADTIRIATEGAYPPFNMKDKSGKLTGFDVDIANALCAQMKVECTIVAQDWDGIIPGLLAGKYDAIVASMSITDERKKKVAFTDPYYRNYLRFVARKGKKLMVDLKGLKGKIVGAQRQTVSSKYLEQNYNGIVKIKVYGTQQAAWLDLKAGRTDAVLADGSKVTLETFVCFIDWFGSRMPLQVIANEGRFPLLGTGLLEQHVLHIDYAKKELSLISNSST